ETSGAAIKAPVKKSLRSKRLMKTGNASSVKAAEPNQSAPVDKPLESIGEKNEKNEKDEMQGSTEGTAAAGEPATHTDTKPVAENKVEQLPEIQNSSSQTTTASSADDDLFVEAKEYPITNSISSPQAMAARPTLITIGEEQTETKNEPVDQPQEDALAAVVSTEDAKEPAADVFDTTGDAAVAVAADEEVGKDNREDSSIKTKETSPLPSPINRPTISPIATTLPAPASTTPNLSPGADDAKGPLLRFNRMSAVIPAVDASSSEAVAARNATLARSVSLRHPPGAAGRRRPSLSAGSKGKNRRSILLTSFTPPVPSGIGLGSGNDNTSDGNSSTATTTRSSIESQTESTHASGALDISIGGKQFKRSSIMLDGYSTSSRRSSNRISPEMGSSAILLRPSTDSNTNANEAKSIIPPSLQNIGARIGSVVGARQKNATQGNNDRPPSPPAWIKEVQRRKQEKLKAQEMEQASSNAELADPAAAAAAAPEAATTAVVAEPARMDNNEDTPLSEINLNASDDSDALPASLPPASNLEVKRSATIAGTYAADKPLSPIEELAYASSAAADPQQLHSSSSPPMNSTSIYRSFSASFGIGQSPPSNSSAAPPLAERQRSPSQTSTTGLFAAVSSFFGRNAAAGSTAANSVSSATLSPGTVAAVHGANRGSSSNASANTMDIGGNGVGGSHPDNSLADMAANAAAAAGAGNSELEDMLLRQLEAQNQQIFNDNKARVFALENMKASAAQPKDAASGQDSNDEDVDWDFWGNLINDYTRVAKNESRKLSRLIHSGIPKAIRGTVWQLMTASKDDPSLGDTYRKLVDYQIEEGNEEESKNEKLIKHDLARTFPKLDYFKDSDGAGQEGLFNVLRAYSLYDREVGYCQGLSFIVGPLLLNMPDEEAFCVLVKLMFTYGLRGHFLPTMDDLQLRLYQFDHIFKDTLPLLCKHFEEQGIETTMYVSQWLMTMFAYRLPIDLTFRLFDVIFAEGLDCLLRVAIAVLKRSQTRLLSLKFEAILQYLNEGPLFAFYTHASPDTLVRDANQVTYVTPKLLARLRKKYIEEMEQKMEEEEESYKLRSENERLQKETVHLQSMLQQVSLEHSELTSEFANVQRVLKQLEEDNSRMQSTIGGLELRLKDERDVAEKQLKQEMDQLAEKNIQLTFNNQKLQDHVQDVEETLVQIKILYAESENQRELLAKKFEDLRRALK
ncbi:GTPase-activating protein, partial [Dipsacomyces acuminosporus]